LMLFTSTSNLEAGSITPGARRTRWDTTSLPRWSPSTRRSGRPAGAGWVPGFDCTKWRVWLEMAPIGRPLIPIWRHLGPTPGNVGGGREL
jgi:hypothetical protein